MKTSYKSALPLLLILVMFLLACSGSGDGGDEITDYWDQRKAAATAQAEIDQARQWAEDNSN